MSGIALPTLVDAGIRPAVYYYANRILAGEAAMPAKPDAELTHAIHYIQETSMPKGAKPIAKAQQVGPTFTGATPVDMAEQEGRVNLALAQVQENAHALAEQLGYDGSLTVGALEDEIRFYQRRSVEAVLELGKRLVILKELTPHGEFLQRMELLGIGRDLGQKFMAATLKFSKTDSTRLLKAAGTQSKMLELLVLDDGEIKSLHNGESVRGLTLDEIETMSVSELKAALRESKEDADAKERLLAEKNAKIDKLTRDKRRKIADPWPDEVAGLKDDVHTLSKVLDECLGKMLTMIDATELSIGAHEEGSDAHTGFKTVIHHIEETVERAATLVAGLRSQHDTRLSGYIALDKTHVLED